MIHQDKCLPDVICLDLDDLRGLKLLITFSCRRCPNVKYLSRTIRVPITFCMASQCLVLSAAFLRLVITGMPCLKLITFCFNLGTTLLGGRPTKEQMLITFSVRNRRLSSVLQLNLSTRTILQTEFSAIVEK